MKDHINLDRLLKKTLPGFASKDESSSKAKNQKVNK